MSRCTSRVTSGVSHGTPTRPDPTRPITTTRGRLHHSVAVGNARGSNDAMMRYAEMVSS